MEHDKSISTPKSQLKSRPSTSTSTSAPSTSNASPANAIASTLTSNYKGFSIAPPRSYHEPQTKAKSNSLIRPVSGGKGRVVPHPYARNLPLSTSTTHNQNQNQNRAPSNQTPSRPSSSLSLLSTPSSSSGAGASSKQVAKEFKSPYTISTPSKATTQAFKPPSFLRNVVAGARFSPNLNLKRSISAGDEVRGEERKTTLEKGTLDLDWEKFAGKN